MSRRSWAGYYDYTEMADDDDAVEMNDAPAAAENAEGGSTDFSGDHSMDAQLAMAMAVDEYQPDQSERATNATMKQKDDDDIDMNEPVGYAAARAGNYSGRRPRKVRTPQQRKARADARRRAKKRTRILNDQNRADTIAQWEQERLELERAEQAERARIERAQMRMRANVAWVRGERENPWISDSDSEAPALPSSSFASSSTAPVPYERYANLLRSASGNRRSKIVKTEAKSSTPPAPASAAYHRAVESARKIEKDYYDRPWSWKRDRAQERYNAWTPKEREMLKNGQMGKSMQAEYRQTLYEMGYFDWWVWKKERKNKRMLEAQAEGERASAATTDALNQNDPKWKGKAKEVDDPEQQQQEEQPTNDMDINFLDRIRGLSLDEVESQVQVAIDSGRELNALELEVLDRIRQLSLNQAGEESSRESKGGKSSKSPDADGEGDYEGKGKGKAE